MFASANWPEWIVGLVLFIVSLIVLCASLILMVKVLNSIFNGPVAKLLQTVVNADFPGPFRHLTPYIAMIVSFIYYAFKIIKTPYYGAFLKTMRAKFFSRNQ